MSLEDNNASECGGGNGNDGGNVHGEDVTSGDEGVGYGRYGEDLDHDRGVDINGTDHGEGVDGDDVNSVDGGGGYGGYGEGDDYGSGGEDGVNGGDGYGGHGDGNNFGNGGGDDGNGGGDGGGGYGGDGGDGDEDGDDSSGNGDEAYRFFRPSSDLNEINLNLGDGTNARVCKCNSSFGCRTCEILKPSDHISSSVTHRMHKVVNNDVAWGNCSSSNLIYLISCDNCGLQYVGQTAQQLRKRMSKHRNDIFHGKGSCPYLVKHFNSGPCQGSNFSVRIIENREGTGRLERGGIDSNLVSDRRDCETKWMLKLRTVYPYGLNHDTGKNLNRGDRIVGLEFPKLSSTVKQSNNRHTRGVMNNHRPQFDVDQFLLFLHEDLQDDIQNVPNKVRILTGRLKKKDSKALVDKLQDYLGSTDTDYEQWFRIIIDCIETQLYKPPPDKSKRKPPKYRLRIPFSSKAFDYINLPNILRKQDSVSLLPEVVDADDIPMVVFSLSQPIRSTIFNYSKFVSSLDLSQANNNIDSVPCPCSAFPGKFVDNHHKHILTGDLSIVINARLRTLLAKGPKYREPVQLDFDVAREDIQDQLSHYIEVIANKYGIEKGQLDAWKAKVMSLVEDRIQETIPKVILRHDPPILDDPNVLQHLKYLHKNFVFAPIDKAGNNVSIICKRLYASIILKELDFSNINSLQAGHTYKSITTSQDILVRQHIDFQASFRLELKEDMHKLPPMHWTPKMHKNPVGQRFIIGSKMSSLKPLSKDLTKIFKLIFHYKRMYWRKAGFFSGVKNFWCIDSNSNITDTLERINKKKNAKSISTFDFTTLYTKIPHDKLIDVLSSLAASTFNDTTRKYIVVHKNKAKWTDGTRCRNYLYSLDKVTSALRFLIENAYFRVGKHIFRQIIGIPIGSDPAPFFANLFLFYYECKWLQQCKKDNFGLARRFLNTFRFIDDLINLNDGGEFSKVFKEIYPPELVLERENASDLEATFLDLHIKIEGGQFVYQLYDKRNYFSFFIVRFPYKSSNMPYKMFYNTISAEVLRICRASFCYDNFITAVEPFMLRMAKQGARRDGVKYVLKKFITRHFVSFSKFGLHGEQLMDRILHFI